MTDPLNASLAALAPVCHTPGSYQGSPPGTPALVSQIPLNPTYQKLQGGLLLFPGVLPWGADLVRVAEAVDQWRPASQGPSGEVVDDYRSNEVVVVSANNDPRFAPYEAALVVLAGRLVQAYRNFNPWLTASTDQGYHLLRYRPGQGYGPHLDATSRGFNSWREVSMTIGLNEGYEGGELHFPTHDFRRQLPKGTGLMFPSHAVPHEAIPPSKGTRYALVTWFYDPLGHSHPKTNG